MSVSHLRMVARQGEDETPEGVRNAERGWRWTWNVRPRVRLTLPRTLNGQGSPWEEPRTGRSRKRAAVGSRKPQGPGEKRRFPEGSLKESPSSWKWSDRVRKRPVGHEADERPRGRPNAEGGAVNPIAATSVPQCFEEQGNFTRDRRCPPSRDFGLARSGGAHHPVS
jgi:hypothetical protein